MMVIFIWIIHPDGIFITEQKHNSGLQIALRQFKAQTMS